MHIVEEALRAQLMVELAISGTFERVGMNIIVFMDYLTKWVKAYATEDQTSVTIARLMVDNIVCRHRVPVELLSDRGINEGCLLSPRHA